MPDSTVTSAIVRTVRPAVSTTSEYVPGAITSNWNLPSAPVYTVYDFPEVWTRYWTGIDMIGLGTGEAPLVVPAAPVVPEGLELWAGGRSPEACLHFGPGRGPMLLHVVTGNLVGDPLETERR